MLAVIDGFSAGHGGSPATRDIVNAICNRCYPIGPDNNSATASHRTLLFLVLVLVLIFRLRAHCFFAVSRVLILLFGGWILGPRSPPISQVLVNRIHLAAGTTTATVLVPARGLILIDSWSPVRGHVGTQVARSCCRCCGRRGGRRRRRHRRSAGSSRFRDIPRGRGGSGALPLYYHASGAVGRGRIRQQILWMASPLSSI